MSSKKVLKTKIIIYLLVFFLILSIFCGGSAVLRNYTPESLSVSEDDGLEDITYNDDVLNEVTGGYSGPPKLVASDDRVFYIPPEYCDGGYLKNFRVIGINQSKANITDGKDGIKSYNGAVVLYGFQTTYREDYGRNYNFDYEPYDFEAEYNTVNSYFKDVVLGQGKNENDESNKNTENTGSNNEGSKNSTNTGEITETTTFEIFNPISVTTKKNKAAIDDSEFKVATVVMEHEIGKNECKILYADADACKVKDLDVGKYNLVTNLNDSALTVCYNENMYVYNFDEENKTYGSNDIYSYKLQDLFNSITFKNTMADAGYCNVSYDIVGDISYSGSSDGWVDVWLSKMSRRNIGNVPNAPQYFSNIKGDTLSKTIVENNLLKMEEFAKKSLESAYSGYKKTGSGFLSYKHSSSISDFSDYRFSELSNNSWKLTNTLKYNVEETSWLVLFPKTYKGSASGSTTVTITPNFKLRSEYNYSINDMLLTKYKDDGNTNKYSIVLQMIITPKSEVVEEETMEPISDFDAYVKDAMSDAPYRDSLPEGVDECELEEKDKHEEATESEEEKEETIEKEISAKYITLNINLSQVSGTERSSNLEITAISNAGELYDYFNDNKDKYKNEYNTSISEFSKENKFGAYVTPDSFTVDGINTFKAEFLKIKEICEKVAVKEAEVVDLNEKKENSEERIQENIDKTNKLGDSLTGDLVLTDKTTGETGYYTQLDEMMTKYNMLANEDGLSKLKDSADATEFRRALLEFFDEVNGVAKYKANQFSVILQCGYQDYDNFILLQNNIVSCLNKNFKKYYNNKLYDEDYITNSLVEIENINIRGIIEGNSEKANMPTTFALDNLMNICDELYGFIEGSKLTDKFWNYYNSNNINNSYNILKNNYSDIQKYKKMYKECSDFTVQIQNMRSDTIGGQIVENYMSRGDLIKELNENDAALLLAEEELVAFRAERDKQIAEFDKLKITVEFSLGNVRLDGTGLAENYTKYDFIIQKADSYITAYNKLIAVADKKNSSDKFINNIKALNTNADISRVIEKMYEAVPENVGIEKYGNKYNMLMYLKDNINKFYFGVNNSITRLAGINGNIVTETTTEVTSEANLNKELIKNTVEKNYAVFGTNKVKAMTYTQIINDCERVYKELYSNFYKVTIQENGNDKEICDVTVEDVQNAVFELLIDKYDIKELSDKNADGTISKTVTLSKNQSSQGNVFENAESTSETTTETIYSDSLSAVYYSYAKLKEYSNNLLANYKGIADIANATLLNSGCLNEEQQGAIDTGDSIDKDITSDYNIGYRSALNIVEEMPSLLDDVKVYYDVREAATKDINSINTGGEDSLNIVLRDDIYYAELYKEKCYEADQIYKLLFNAARARGKNDQDTLDKLISEYESTDWIVDDIKVTPDLSSAMSVKTTTVTTTYQKVDWNTALIKSDVASNVTSTPYELYQMNSNFCIGISDNVGFVVPMGAQANIKVESLNKKIREEIAASGIKEINNAAYGYNNGYYILLFSSDTKWFMVAFKQNGNAITVDTGKVVGYSGAYTTGDEDAHFLEYDHTNITGVNQLFSTTIENGYKPYKITLSGKRNGTIIPEEASGDEDYKGIEGAFFNSWSESNGNVVLLGYRKEDMELETETEASSEATTTASIKDKAEVTTGANIEANREETTEEKKYREINDEDIYKAHLYVLKYDTKAAEPPTDGEDNDFWETGGGSLYDAGIRLEGPFGKLLEPAVNIITVARKAVIGIVYALAIVYAVYLGIKYSKAGEEEERKKALTHIKWFLIAIVGTHLLIVILYLSSVQLEQWTKDITIVQSSELTTDNVETTTVSEDNKGS